jgi:two-component system LytT family response regulator
MTGIRNNECDILFLDISMPGKSGLDILSLLPDYKGEVIFVTAHSEYALNAIKFGPAGYVLKPIDDEQLIRSVEIAVERANFKRAHYTATAPSAPKKIGIPDSKGIEYVEIDALILLEAVNNCTKVITTDAEIVSSYSLARFRHLLNPQTFFQVHRSFIVNLNYVKRYTNSGMIVVRGGREVPLSKSVRNEFLLTFSKVTKE